MSDTTASEKVDDEEIVIDVDEPGATIEDLPGVGPATAEKLLSLIHISEPTRPY